MSLGLLSALLCEVMHSCENSRSALRFIFLAYFPGPPPHFHWIGQGGGDGRYLLDQVRHHPPCRWGAGDGTQAQVCHHPAPLTSLFHLALTILDIYHLLVVRWLLFPGALLC